MYFEKKFRVFPFLGSNRLQSIVWIIATPPGFRYCFTLRKCSTQYREPTCSKKPVDMTESY